MLLPELSLALAVAAPPSPPLVPPVGGLPLVPTVPGVPLVPISLSVDARVNAG